MKAFALDKYPNFYDHCHLDKQAIEEQIRFYGLEFLPVRDEAVEWMMKFPMFIHSFYKLVYLNGYVPMQLEFWSQYILDNGHYFKSSGTSSITLTALKARAYRAYPSLVRDIHFGCSLRERLLGYIVLYNRALDTEEGIDLLISFGQRFWGLNLFLNSERSLKGRAKKSTRHLPFENVKYVDIPINKFSNQVGKFYLYGQPEIDKVIKALEVNEE